MEVSYYLRIVHVQLWLTSLEAPVSTDPMVINLHVYILRASIKIMTAIYKLLQNIWQVNLQLDVELG